VSDLASDPAPGRLLQQMVGNGELGVKSGRGFYDWSKRSSEELLQARDQEILRQLKILRAENTA
jgi:3-hydroxybutyryl-CoA dehydrogenase